jgi:hypothetical protein
MMSKPTQGGKNGGNSKVEETGTAKNSGNGSSAKGNSQSVTSGTKVSGDAAVKSTGKASGSKSSSGSKSK